MDRGRVRRFVEEDVPQVGDLHRRIFLPKGSPPEIGAAYGRFFREVYLNNPWYDEALSPLVYEESGGKISGFLGVIPRPMRAGNRRIQAAVSSMFMVDPNHRFGLAAISLLKAHLAGPQDLSLSDEATTASRTLWERIGGSTSLIHSLYWTRALRPARFLNLRLSRHKRLRLTAVAAAPLCRLADAALARLSPGRFPQPRARLRCQHLEVPALLECTRAFWRHGLRPEYDEYSLRWLLDLARHSGPENFLEKVGVWNTAGNLVGWYVYCLNRERVAEVLQIGSERNFGQAVLDHLLHRAWRQGAVAATGRLDPNFIWNLGAAYAVNPRYWMLVHSRNRELLDTIARGESFLTRLDGEWCLQFHKERYRELNSAAPSAASPPQLAACSAVSGGNSSALPSDGRPA